MRLRTALARAALIAGLALVAAPGLVGSSAPSPDPVIDASALRELTVASAPAATVRPPDQSHRSASFVGPGDALVEPADPPVLPLDLDRPDVSLPPTSASSERKPPRMTLTGEATFYDNGTTAMRLPRGTRVVICGAGGCIERIVNDYGPQKPSRIVDLYRPDFFRICGCGWWAGVTRVTVYVY